jgi:S-layer family protein
MNYKRQFFLPATLLLSLVLFITAATRLHADTATCGGASINLPFTDVPSSNIFFCSIAAAYFSGLTNGTSPTSYSPTASVTREQMAAFITRTQDSVLRRGSLRAALNQWAEGSFSAGGMTSVNNGPRLVRFDGADLWVANAFSNTVSRVRSSDGKLLETWTGAANAFGVLVARGRIFVTGDGSPGSLYRIDPKQTAGDVTLVAGGLVDFPQGIATDGDFIWTANGGGSVCKVDPGTGDVTTFSTGFDSPVGILYDGSNIWVTDLAAGTLLKLNPNGTIAHTVTVGTHPAHPIFDGTNIWVPNTDADTVTVVRVKNPQGNPLPTAFVLATLTGNGLDNPFDAAFDGQRILITNAFDDSITLWKAGDLTPRGSFSSGTLTSPVGARSDGINFWVTLHVGGKLARF